MSTSDEVTRRDARAKFLAEPPKPPTNKWVQLGLMVLALLAGLATAAGYRVCPECPQCPAPVVNVPPVVIPAPPAP